LSPEPAAAGAEEAPITRYASKESPKRPVENGIGNSRFGRLGGPGKGGYSHDRKSSLWKQAQIAQNTPRDSSPSAWYIRLEVILVLLGEVHACYMAKRAVDPGPGGRANRLRKIQRAGKQVSSIEGGSTGHRHGGPLRVHRCRRRHVLTGRLNGRRQRGDCRSTVGRERFRERRL
jgi:hypothetical protein